MTTLAEFWDNVIGRLSCCSCPCCFTKVRRIEVTVSASETCSTEDEVGCTFNRSVSGSTGSYTLIPRPAGAAPSDGTFDLEESSPGVCNASNTANKIFSVTGTDTWGGPSPCLNDSDDRDEEHEVSVSVSVDCFGVGTASVSVLGPFGGAVTLDINAFGASSSDSDIVSAGGCTTTVSATVTVHDTDA